MPVTIPPATYLPDFLAYRATERPDKPCWIFGERTWTWAEAWESVRSTAGALQADGVGRGDRVAILDKNNPAILQVMLGGCQLGAATTVVNWRLAGDELDYVLNDCAAQRGVRRPPAARAVRPRARPPRARREGHRRRRRARRVRGVAGGRHPDRPPARRRPRRRLRRDVQLRHHRPTQGRTAQPARHGRAQRQRPRRCDVRRRRHAARRDADVPRRRHVVRADRPGHRRARLHHQRGRRRCCSRAA